MSDAFVYAVVIIAMIGPLAGVVLGVYLGRRSGPSEVPHLGGKLVRCPHGNEWYSPPPPGVSLGCSLCAPGDPVMEVRR